MKEQYINIKGYTDIESYKVLSLTEDKATVIEVEKKCEHESVPGGFAFYFPNLKEEFEKCEPTVKEGAQPIELVKFHDNYGRWEDIIIFQVLRSQLSEEGVKQFEADDEYTKVKVGDDTQYILYDRTKAGKVKKHFVKFGKPVDYCSYFYDFNF